MSTRKGRTITILKPKRGSQEATSDLEGKSCERDNEKFQWNNTNEAKEQHLDFHFASF